MIGKSGTTTKARKLPPVPTYAAKITKRADMRARLVIDRASDFVRLDPSSGVLLIIEVDFTEGFEVVAAEVYAVHAEYRIVDVRLRADLPLETRAVSIKRTSLGVMA